MRRKLPKTKPAKKLAKIGLTNINKPKRTISINKSSTPRDYTTIRFPAKRSSLSIANQTQKFRSKKLVKSQNSSSKRILDKIVRKSSNRQSPVSSGSRVKNGGSYFSEKFSIKTSNLRHVKINKSDLKSTQADNSMKSLAGKRKGKKVRSSNNSNSMVSPKNFYISGKFSMRNTKNSKFLDSSRSRSKVNSQVGYKNGGYLSISTDRDRDKKVYKIKKRIGQRKKEKLKKVNGGKSKGDRVEKPEKSKNLVKTPREKLDKRDKGKSYDQKLTLAFDSKNVIKRKNARNSYLERHLILKRRASESAVLSAQKLMRGVKVANRFPKNKSELNKTEDNNNNKKNKGDFDDIEPNIGIINYERRPFGNDSDRDVDKDDGAGVGFNLNLFKRNVFGSNKGKPDPAPFKSINTAHLTTNISENSHDNESKEAHKSISGYKKKQNMPKTLSSMVKDKIQSKAITGTSDEQAARSKRFHRSKNFLEKVKKSNQAYRQKSQRGSNSGPPLANLRNRISMMKKNVKSLKAHQTPLVNPTFIPSLVTPVTTTEQSFLTPLINLQPVEPTPGEISLRDQIYDNIMTTPYSTSTNQSRASDELPTKPENLNNKEIILELKERDQFEIIRKTTTELRTKSEGSEGISLSNYMKSYKELEEEFDDDCYSEEYYGFLGLHDGIPQVIQEVDSSQEDSPLISKEDLSANIDGSFGEIPKVSSIALEFETKSQSMRPNYSEPACTKQRKYSANRPEREEDSEKKATLKKSYSTKSLFNMCTRNFYNTPSRESQNEKGLNESKKKWGSASILKNKSLRKIKRFLNSVNKKKRFSYNLESSKNSAGNNPSFSKNESKSMKIIEVDCSEFDVKTEGE